MSLTTPDKIRNLQKKLYCLAKTVTRRGVVGFPSGKQTSKAAVANVGLRG
jgi:hypothetical protein